MYGTLPVKPPWLEKHEPIYSVGNRCVLEWPDNPNCNEFPLFCPIHGVLSRFCIEPVHPLCECKRFKKKPLESEQVLAARQQGDERDEDEILAWLRRLRGGELDFDSVSAFCAGAPVDPRFNRLACLNGDQLSSTPRGPVIVNSHSLRSLSEDAMRKPRLKFDDVKLNFVYSYLEDLGMDNELCIIFISQMRRTIPRDLQLRDPIVDIMVHRKPNRVGFKVNIFPGRKSFISYIDYQHFAMRPNIHYSDEILEIGHCMLRPNTTLSSARGQLDSLRLRIRPSPFLKWINFAVGDCPIASDKQRNKYGAPVKTHRDLGFTMFNGCVTEVAKHSPASRAGLEPDHQLVEIDGTYVIQHTDDQRIDLIRNAITRSSKRSVWMVVLPKKIYERMQFVKNEFFVNSNRGFDIASWINGEVFGFTK